MTFDVNTEVWQALGVILVERYSDQEFASGGMRNTYYPNLGIENKNHLLSGFKVGDDIVLKQYTTKVKEQATAKGRSLRNMAMNVCNSIRVLYTLKGHAKAFFFVCLCFVIVVVLGYTWFCWYPILKMTV